jgi:uncharacterized SAM-binding protein YcdF (DUF218 family)
MFFILSKTAFYLLMPMTWIVGLLLYALLTKFEKRRKLALKGAVVLLFVLGNNFLVNEVISWWEVPVTPIRQLPGPYDVAVILTGVTDTERKPNDRVYFRRGADRVLHPLQLFKVGKVKHFLISGGSGNVVGSQESEAEELAAVLRIAGVPRHCITLENKSRNTRENAVFSARVLKEKFPGKSYLLVTSAFHMRRAEGCFRKAGVPVTLYSTDFYSHGRKWTPNQFFPTEGALGRWSGIWHEWIGYITYRVMGYA